MASFLNANGEIQQVSLDVTAYRAAADAGQVVGAGAGARRGAEVRDLARRGVAGRRAAARAAVGADVGDAGFVSARSGRFGAAY